MSKTLDLYAHRGSDGFAFCSVEDPEGGTMHPSYIERLESAVFGKWDTELGPHPSDANREEIHENLDSPFPLERDRKPQLMYKVGEILVDDGELVHFEIFDEVEEVQVWDFYDPCIRCRSTEFEQLSKQTEYVQTDEEGEVTDIDPEGTLTVITVTCKNCEKELYEVEG